MAASVSFSTSTDDGYTVLRCGVSSGKPANNKGFFHLVFDVPALFSLKAYFDSEAFYATDPRIVPPECQSIADELDKLAKQYDDVVSQLLKDGHKPLDNPQAEELLAKRKKKYQQLHACLGRKRSVRAAMAQAFPPTPGVPPECQGIADELDALQKQYNKVVSQLLKDGHKPLDNPQAEALLGKRKQKYQQLHACIESSTWVAPRSVRDLIESSYP